jgi:hypothetical protein
MIYTSWIMKPKNQIINSQRNDEINLNPIHSPVLSNGSPERTNE